jgi:hypothetical protein
MSAQPMGVKRRLSLRKYWMEMPSKILKTKTEKKAFIPQQTKWDSKLFMGKTGPSKYHRLN